ncbi:MAG: type II toxin-antitoxin system VapC family toxin [Acidimicrobiales bacterium]|jgi:predicted nucleic acid-binding protein
MADVIIVDASCLYEVLVDTPRSESIRTRMGQDSEQAAPHVVDIEVFSLIRRDFLSGSLDSTAAALAVADLRMWPGERYGHRGLLSRAWELRENVRGWDAAYVALAEALDATLITLDGRLARAEGPTCRIELIA